MDDYIKREDCIKRDEDYIKRKDVKRKAYDLDNNFVIDLCDVNLIPSVDVAPIRHGRWSEENIIACGGFVREYYECSICFDRNICRSKYCPNCGAKMDGENDE